MSGAAIKFADSHPYLPWNWPKELEYPDKADTDYNTKTLG
jgi:hypothetical protein